MSPRAEGGLRVIACLFIILFVGVADSQIISPLLPAIRAHVGKSSASVGLLFTGYSLAAGLSVLCWGPLSDLFGRKRGLLMGLMLFALGSALAFLASSFTALLLSRILTGMGASMLSLNVISYAADYFPYSNRGWAMGCIMSSYFAAMILGVPLGAWIGDRLGWNAIFGVTACTVLVLIVLTYYLLPQLGSKSWSFAESVFARQMKVYAGFLSSRGTLLALLASFFASAGTMGFLAFLGVWLYDAFRVPAREVGLIFLVSGAAALVASPIAGSLSDRIGKRRQFLLSNVSLAVFLLVLPSAHARIMLFGICGLISLSAAFRQGPMEALLTEVISGSTRGSFVALKNSFSQIGIASAAFASGLLFEQSGYFSVCMLGAAANLAAAGMIFLMHDRRL